LVSLRVSLIDQFAIRAERNGGNLISWRGVRNKNRKEQKHEHGPESAAVILNHHQRKRTSRSV